MSGAGSTALQRHQQGQRLTRHHAIHAHDAEMGVPGTGGRGICIFAFLWFGTGG